MPAAGADEKGARRHRASLICPGDAPAMLANLRTIHAFILREEGGFSNDPADPGGATMKGVTQAVYDAWRVKQGQVKRSVRLITDDEGDAIFRTGYWNQMNGDTLASGVDLVAVDGAFNSGVSQSKKWLQRAVLARSDIVGQIRTYCSLRLSMLQGLKTWGKFGKGWSGRVARSEAAALKLAGLSGKALAREANASRISAAANAKKATVTATGGGAATASTAVAPISPEQTLLLVLFAVLVIGAIVAALVWRAKTDETRAQALDAASGPDGPDSPATPPLNEVH